jgi:hypothetical protein
VNGPARPVLLRCASRDLRHGPSCEERRAKAASTPMVRSLTASAARA